MTINLDHVTEQIQVTDEAANASLTVQPKGTGAFNIAAGSSGVNISNGGTVTAITRTNQGANYTSVPSVAISAPTTAGGVQAVVTCVLGMNGNPTVTTGGTGYTLNDILTVSGGTGSAAQLQVTGVSGGVITSVSVVNSVGAYSVIPTNPFSATGGTGSSATFTLTNWAVGTTFTISNAGSGYVEQPTVTFSGGGGSGAVAYAVVGGATTIKGIGGNSNASILFATAGGAAFSVADSGRATVDYWEAIGSSGAVGLRVAGATTNNNGIITSKGTGYISLQTNAFASEALRATHAASVVNYVQVQGNSAGNGPFISAQGSDTNVGLIFQNKGQASFEFRNDANLGVFGIELAPNTTVDKTTFIDFHSSTGTDYDFRLSRNPGVNGNAVYQNAGSGSYIFYTATNVNQFTIAHTASAVNYLQATGSTTGGGPIISAQGSDSSVELALSSKSTGGIRFMTNGVAQTQMLVSHTASAVNYVQVTGAATGGSPTISAQGSDSNTPLIYQTKGFGSHQFRGYGGSNIFLNVIAAQGSPVNYVQIGASSSGNPLIIQAAGSDTDIPLVLQPKGTGALQAQQTDSTATGGNARGANAVDWQTARNASSQVASSQYSVVSGGFGNTSSSLYSGISSGLGNTSNNLVTIVAGGQSNTASGTYSSILGGVGNTSAGYLSTISGGQNNAATGYFNVIGGGYTNTATATAAVTTQSGTMNGTTAVTLSGSNASIKVGQYITGTSIAGNTYVAAISGTSLTLSQAASGSSTSTLSFFTPHGVVVGGGNNQATGSYSFIGGGGDAGTAANRNVASGDWASVLGGTKNTASGNHSSVSGGYGAVASGVASFVGGGGLYGDFSLGAFAPNTASGVASSVVGGFNNTASSNGTAVVGSVESVASGLYSSVFGGSYGTTRGLLGVIVFPANNNPLNTRGGSQAALFVLGVQTTDATATILRTNTSAAGNTNQVILPNNSAYYFKGSVIAGVTGAGDTSSWSFEGTIKRGANAASTALVGTPVLDLVSQDTGASTWTVALTADTTNGGLAVTVTGQASTTIRWVAKIETTEMTF